MSQTIEVRSHEEPELAGSLAGIVPELFSIGDAAKIRKAPDAIAEGYVTGLKI